MALAALSPLDPTQSQLLADLRAFLLQILPPGVEVIQAQDNRVPEPQGDDFVTMTPTMRMRLATNGDSFADCTLTGSVTSNVLTATNVNGKITVGLLLFGRDLPILGARIMSQISGAPGASGQYTMFTGTPDVTSQAMAAGNAQAKQETQVSIQLDVHGPNSADNTQIITTLFRDEYATSFFDTLGHGVSPLYADEGRQLPFLNEEQQIENRWVVNCELQVDPIVTTPQQFAEQLSVKLVSVEANFIP